MKLQKVLLFLTGSIIFAMACSGVSTSRQEHGNEINVRETLRKDRGVTSHAEVLFGKASYYGPKFHGKPTANGEIFNMYEFTAAHRTLPFGTLCRVTNLKNEQSVVVRINDRGPFIAGRIIDLSMAAARTIDAHIDGIAEVKIEILKYGEQN